MKLQIPEIQLRKWHEPFFITLGILLILRASMGLIFNPNLFMDEGLFIGAAKAILNGDLFLHHYGFDKPFLLAFMPIPGMLLFGETPLGFHFVPLLCYFSAFGFFFKSLQKISPFAVRNFLFALALFSIPTVQEFGISNFIEPYLLFFFSLLIYTIVTHQAQKVISRVFFLGMMLKYSFLLIAPVIIIHEILENPGRKGVQAWLTWGKSFLFHSRFILLLWFVYGALNNFPFASITWASVLYDSPTHQLSFFERVYEWGSRVAGILNSGAIALLFVVFLVMNGFLGRIFEPGRKWFYVLTCGAVLHFFAFPLSHAPLFERYLVQFIPLLFLGVFAGFAILDRLGFIGRGSTLMLSMVLLSIYYPLPKKSVAGEAESGRTLYVIREELNRPNVLLHDENQMQTQPFRNHLISVGCMSDGCIEEAQTGVKIQRNEYFYENKSLYRVYPFKHLEDAQVTHINVPQSRSDLVNETLKRLKISKVFQVDHVEIHDPVQAEWSQKQPLFNGSQVTIFLTAVKHVPMIVSVGDSAKIDLVLGLHDLHEYPARYNQPRYQLLARVNRIELNAHDITDIMMPHFFSGYVFELKRIPEVWSETKWLDQPVFGGSDEISIRMLQLKEKKAK